MTMFIFEEEIDLSINFSRDVSNCFDLLVDWCSDRAAIQINFFWLSVALSFNKNFDFDCFKKVSQLHMIFKEEKIVIKVWNYLCCYCLCWFQNCQEDSLYKTWNQMLSQRFKSQFQLGCFHVPWPMLFQRRWAPISKMNKEHFLHYFF